MHGPIHSPYAAADPAAAAAAPTSDATAAASVSSRPPSRALLAVYFLLGAGVLSAWNALITATDYFGLVYPVRGRVMGYQSKAELLSIFLILSACHARDDKVMLKC